MPRPIVTFFVHSRLELHYWIPWAILLGPVFVYSIILVWPNLERLVKEGRAHDWPTVPGVIDIATVTRQVSQGGGKSGVVIEYMAMLTYSYRNGDMQTGDYNRLFPYERDAQEWANSCRGRTVPVRVDPRNPTRSVLETKELDAVFAEHSCP